METFWKTVQHNFLFFFSLITKLPILVVDNGKINVGFNNEVEKIKIYII